MKKIFGLLVFGLLLFFNGSAFATTYRISYVFSGADGHPRATHARTRGIKFPIS